MKRKVLKVLGFLGGLGIVGGFLGVAILAYFSFSLPRISTLADYRPPIHSQIMAKDGTVLADVGIQKREISDFEEIPQRIINAFLAAEDDGCYQHKGVDYFGLLRALIANLKAGRVVQGGSTITQQVAKSLLLTSEKSITRKIKDFLLAQKIEKKSSKEEILYLYLNQVYFGGGFYGVKAAFRGYYGKELSEATVAESAMIAGLLVAPGRYSPYINPEFAKKRQEYVLGRLWKTEKISQEEYEEARNEKIKFRIRKKNKFRAGYFTDWVRQRVVDLVGEDAFLRDGFRVVTTLDWQLQEVAEKEVLKGVKKIDKRQGFLGPHRHIDELEAQEEYEIRYRKKILIEKSQYFTLTEDFRRQYEIEFSEEEFKERKEEDLLWNEEIGSQRFVKGISENDSLRPNLSVGKMYEALVVRVDDWAQIIYVSLGGVVGIIPLKGFQWAHERVIIEQKNFYPRVTKPSSIVKPGDVIMVTIESVSRKGWKYFAPGLKRRFSNHKKLSSIKKQKYLLCSLDQIPEAQGALVSVAPKTGEIIAFVGGADFDRSQFNRAVQSKRQPGSSFKPILYAAALENGFTPATIIMDSPEALGGVDETLNWKPRNYDGKFLGPITFRNALEHSRNIPTIKIADKLGVPRILDFSNRIGFNAKLDLDLSLALGAFGVTLVDIVTTYAIFPNGGRLIGAKSIISITDRDGNMYLLDESENDRKIDNEEEEQYSDYRNFNEVEYEENFVEMKEGEDVIFDPSAGEKVNIFLEHLGADQVYDPRLAYLMTNLLRGVVLHGTGRSAKEVSHYLGGKTGTTNSYVDAWFLGFSSSLVTGVWTGMDDNKTLGWGETGSKSALPIWKEFMRAGNKKYGEQDFIPPKGIVNVLIEKETGRLAKSGEGFMEAFVEGREPTEQSEREQEEALEENSGSVLEDDDYYNNQ